MFEAGYLSPVQPITIMPLQEIEHAFRLIQARKHTGKIVLEAGDKAIVKLTPLKPPPLTLDSNGTYLIAGGLGDLGRHVARFLTSRKAGHIILLSRRSLDAQEQNLIKEEL